MSTPEEFEVVIGKDGRIRLDFRGMNEESYRRIVQVLEETVGPAEALEAEAEEASPPGVQRYGSGETSAHDRDEESLRQGG